jgi:predicted transcriptional regulator of viral defense system
LGKLPLTFTYSNAREAGLSEWKLYALLNAQRIERIGRGLYRRMDAPPADLDLIEIAQRAPLATLCLTTALSRHDLTDAIPGYIDVALPRGHYIPATSRPVAWHKFDVNTFQVGRETLEVDSHSDIGIYGPERSIIDAYRLRHLQGEDLGKGALRRWLRWRGATPAKLMHMAERFPKAATQLRKDLAVLL